MIFSAKLSEGRQRAKVETETQKEAKWLFTQIHLVGQVLQQEAC